MFTKTKGVIAAGNWHTANAGKIIMENGGNVFDAVVAACFASFVTEAGLTSFGGSGFLLAQQTNKEAVLYDFFSKTPLHKRPTNEIEFYPVNFDFDGAIQEYFIGLGSMTVPGCPIGMFQIHKDLGRMPFNEVLQPAIDMANNGIEVSKYMGFINTIVQPVWERLPAESVHFKKEGALLKNGDTQYYKSIGNTLEYIAKNGIREIYEGEIAQTVAKDCLENGGHLTTDDFINYSIDKLKPLQFVYGGKTILTNPTPSLGGSLIQLGLQLLSEKTDSNKNNNLVEVMRDVNTMRAAGLDKDIKAKGLSAAVETLNMFGNTTHISVIDDKGNAASTTTTLGEGAGYIPKNAGFMLNNMLGEADLMPEGFHNWKPNSKISSMMAPTMIYGKNGVEAALGSGGSNRIRTAILQVINNLVSEGLPAKQAVEAARVHLEFGTLQAEPIEDENTLKNIPLINDEQLNIWSKKRMFFGGVHTVTSKDGEIDGAGDSRRDGVVLFSK